MLNAPFRACTAVLALVLASSAATPSRAQENFGHFIGRVVASFLEDGRNMRLEEPFEYVDPEGQKWPVPKGATTDGASIPQGFWMTHPPFTGRYREAAVVHDYYCQTKDRPWQDTHKIFYEAMRASGVQELTAKLMYGAVYRFGPRWGDDGSATRSIGDDARGIVGGVDEQALMRRTETWIKASNPSPDEIAQAMETGRIPVP